ncbi:formylglycine-generating enzyme family protein [Desulfatibacillum aliphaticivorans]|uniref:formylglycine-generating enzyme family protein n=1 Tax=Desulfatibacillum aliphaticivorans TaxID=218208 RepID=UPI000424FF20|nr:formylglycine-generating enzyme family protein [Desulfatibacillum aliphaticivorans]
MKPGYLIKFAACLLTVLLFWLPAYGMGPKPKVDETQTGAGEDFTDPATGMEFIWIPGGPYFMGCGDWAGDCDLDEEPAHEVQLQGFWISKTEVTQGQWKKIMGFNPSHFDLGDDYPVENVSWTNAKEFVRRLTVANDMKYWFDVPSEAQWEYVCRSGGQAEQFAGTADPLEAAWFLENSQGTTHPVASKKPNGLGVYDMSGNVWEWCRDQYDVKAYAKHEPNDPVFRGEEPYHVIRGGAFNFNAFNVRCGVRNDSAPGDPYYDIGFRLVRTY